MIRREPSGGTPVRIQVAGLASRTHLVYAASYVRHLLRRTTGPIEVAAQPISGFRGRTVLTADDVRRAFPVDPLLRFVPPDEPVRRGTRIVLLSVGVPGIKPYLAIASQRRRPWVIVCDEGIGTYGDLHTRRAALRREGASAVRASVVAAVRTAGDRILTDQRWNLYVRGRRRAGWRVENEVAEEFRRTVTRSGTPRRTAVYLTQPWVELGLISAAGYREHLTAVATACSEAGLVLQVRPHPVDDPALYAGLDLITGPIPAELDPRVVDASVVVGGPSTALLNLAAVHEVPAIWLRLPETARLEAAMSDRQAGLLRTFLPIRAAAPDLAPLLTRALG